MPYKDPQKQKDAMQKIMRNYRQREKQRQAERLLRQVDKSSWQRLYRQKRRKKQ
jgi:hypothetical protein